MSSEIPLYALVDKSRKNYDEPGTDKDIDVPNTYALQFPARNTLLKKKPLVSPCKSEDKIEDRGENETVGGLNTPNQAKSKYYTVFAIGAVIPGMLIILTFIVSIIALTDNTETVTFQGQLTNYSNLYSSLQEQFTNEVEELKAKHDCASFITSCSSLAPSCPSGYYLIGSASVVSVYYCDMTLSCGGVTGGWMRVAELNMTDTSQQCPGGLVERSEIGLRQCQAEGSRNLSVNYSISNIGYSSVCGRITAYQVGSTNAFRKCYENQDTSTIDSAYVDGVSLTHGRDPREHVWTFAAALDKQDGNVNSKCPCLFNRTLPSFVGEDYFCDAGNEEFTDGEFGLQTDPLWDGTDCLCCDNPPWFYKHLPQPTTDDIEMRVYKDEDDEDIGIQEVEIYVQ